MLSFFPISASPGAGQDLPGQQPELGHLQHCLCVLELCRVSFPTGPQINQLCVPSPPQQQLETPSCALPGEPDSNYGRCQHWEGCTSSHAQNLVPTRCGAHRKPSQGERPTPARWLQRGRALCLCPAMHWKGTCRSATPQQSCPYGKDIPCPRKIIPFSSYCHCAAGHCGTFLRHRLLLEAFTTSYPEHA